MAFPPYYQLWAKTEKSTGKIHPLLYHMIDVGQVMLALWRTALPEQTRDQYAAWFKLSEADAGGLMAFWAALHDLGKAAPGFQRKFPAAVPRLENVGFVFPKPSLVPAPHGILTAWALKSLLVEETGVSRSCARAIAHALGGHHGSWPTPSQFLPHALQEADKGIDLWDSARRSLFQEVRELFNPVIAVNLPNETQEQNAFLTLFSGFVSLADWIGSMSEMFPFEEGNLNAGAYAVLSAQRAQSALDTLGWTGWHPDGSELSFMQMFPFTPNAIQEAVIATALNQSLPVMVILEAPTGIGKTEIALYLADHWLNIKKGRGLYIAMPTQATSNQMFGRFTDYLLNRYPQDQINPFLAHGGALLADGVNPAIAGIYDEDVSAQNGIRAQSWFQPRKRTLLAPFAVGTVDQTLMAVLQTRHFFVRMFGLGQKVVIFDEIHAYDTYMSALFQRLLGWLRQIGTSVILLSATLPENTRESLVAAWQGKKPVGLPQASYPRLTCTSPEGVTVIPLPSPASHLIKLDKIDLDPMAIAAKFSRLLEQGGCAAVICNRVDRAQKVYQAIKQTGMIAPGDLYLFHARFPFAWRETIENKVLDLFGKKGHRPKRAVVVATQVIEQSLDLDFDLMISDLAPIDLLLQRAGRLHRHPKNDVTRPANLSECRLVLCQPPEEDGCPQFGNDEYIYDRSILMRTWLTINPRTEISIPDETSALIEAVYSSDDPQVPISHRFVNELRAADEEKRRSSAKEIFQAAQRIIASPEDEDLLDNRNENLEEDDPKVHQAFQALTRLIEPSVSLICLHQTPNGPAFEPGAAPVNLAWKPDFETIKQLLRCALTVQRREVVRHFLSSGDYPWKDTAALSHHFLVVFDENGLCHLPDAPFTLKLDRETGLEILLEGK